MQNGAIPKKNYSWPEPLSKRMYAAPRFTVLRRHFQCRTKVSCVLRLGEDGSKPVLQSLMYCLPDIQRIRKENFFGRGDGPSSDKRCGPFGFMHRRDGERGDLFRPGRN